MRRLTAPKPVSDPIPRLVVRSFQGSKHSLSGFFLLLCTLLSVSGQAQQAVIDLPEPDALGEAWLVTYGPGDIYWQRFGHNAIWIRDPKMGVDHTFNFGFFDFNQEHFLLNFIQGRMLYFSIAQPVLGEFRQYIAENRDISAQKLELSTPEYTVLRDYLLQVVQPQNREYLYDYYLANCSTKVRDALDLALGGGFSKHFQSLNAVQNFRDHTRRSVATDYWYYLGLETGLGVPVDRGISAWQEMFLPAKVSEAVSNFNTARGPLSGPVKSIYRSGNAPPAARPAQLWWRYLAAGLALMLFFALLGKISGPVVSEGSALGWLMVTGTAGGLLLYLWLGTDHAAAGPNVNLLLLNPLFLLGLVPNFRQIIAWLMVVGLILAAAQWILPVHQFNLDLLAFLAPLHLASAWALSGRSKDVQPGFNRW